MSGSVLRTVLFVLVGGLALVLSRIEKRRGYDRDAAAQDAGRTGATPDPPEVQQRSPVECGPAALASVLRGYGLDVPYAEIARLSAVDVEGASIDRLEVLANQFGLGAEQVMLPVDHVFLPGQHRGPTIAVAKTTEGLKHFLVLWRASGETVEIMDPSVGQRSWVPRTELLSRLYVHQISLPAKSWNEWAHSAEFREGLLERMRRLRVSGSDRQALWVAASNDPSPLGLEALDAAIRFEGIGATVRPDAGKDVRQLFECSRTPSCVQPRVPPNYWFAREGGRDKAGESQVAVRGAVMIAFQRRIGPIR